MSDISTFSRVVSLINVIGEEAFTEELDSIETKYSSSNVEVIAKIVSVEFDIPFKKLIRGAKIKIPGSNFTFAKYLFVYIVSQNDMKKLIQMKYSRQTIYRARKTIEGLLPQNKQHKEIILKKEKIESILNN